MICAACGHENGENARFCEACGAPLGGGSGERRKVVSALFCDVVGSTALGESMDPEALRALLARYFDRMKGIVERHGGSVDKFIGDAMLIFFGDPETKGERLDAQACLRMAWEMQRRLIELNAKWRSEGVEQPFKTRMGINSGYCNVGNFGSEQRMDYTIIGGEANLAARLQSIAEPGGIVVSYETFILLNSENDDDGTTVLLNRHRRCARRVDQLPESILRLADETRRRLPRTLPRKRRNRYRICLQVPAAAGAAAWVSISRRFRVRRRSAPRPPSPR